jgi:hypothetical protein
MICIEGGYLVLSTSFFYSMMMMDQPSQYIGSSLIAIAGTVLWIGFMGWVSYKANKLL